MAEERARLARELHDSVGHALNVVVLHAGAAQRILETKPELAREALGSIETAGRHALGDIERMLGILRVPDEGAGLDAAPGLGQVEALCASVREAGLPVHLVVEGTPQALPSSVDLSAYRIVQEALTNTLKHAGKAQAWVTIRYMDEALEIEVLDDGRGGSVAGFGRGGHGLAGMRERIDIFGGELLAGPREEGGFAIRRTPAAAQGGDMSITVVVVDDEQLVRSGLRLILEAEPGIEVVGEAGDGRQAVELTRRLDPQVVLMDVQMPVMNGIEATREIAALGREDSSRVLILTTFDLDEYVYEGFKAGASGFLLKRTPAEDLVAGIGVVASGEGMVAPSVTMRLIEHFRGRGERAGSPPGRRGPGRPHRARARSPRPGRARHDESRHRSAPLPVGGDGQDAREAHLLEARRCTIALRR